MEETLNRKIVIGFAGLVLVGLALAGCIADERAPANGKDITAGRNIYVPKNDVEGKNYNARLRIADSPATLIWCSVYPTNPNVKPFTVPIAGKLTSSGKRPEPTSQSYVGSEATRYNPELPDAQGMYGSSDEYRYGFDPAGNYHDFYGLEVYCTTVPTVIQKNTTEIAISASGDLNAIDKQVEAALEACRKQNTDPSAPCPAAAKLLGV